MHARLQQLVDIPDGALWCLKLSDNISQKVPSHSKQSSDAEIRAQAAENRQKQQSQQGLPAQAFGAKPGQGAEAQQAQQAASLNAQQTQQGAGQPQVRSNSKLYNFGMSMHLVKHRKHSTLVAQHFKVRAPNQWFETIATLNAHQETQGNQLLNKYNMRA